MARTHTSGARRRKQNMGTGTGAWLGSIVGGTVGGLVGAPFGKKLAVPLAYLGSIAGAGFGGHMAAPKDRQQRGALGGVIGEAIFPLFGIGAAVGGHYGGKKPDKKKNPSGLALGLAVLAGAGALTAGYYGYRKLSARADMKSLPPAQALEAILMPGATLAESEWVVGDIQQPIYLATVPADTAFDQVPDLAISVPETGTTNELQMQPATAVFGSGDDDILRVTDTAGVGSDHQTPGKAIGALVTNLEPERARLAYELALHQIVNKGVDWSDGSHRDAAIKKILKSVAPKVDWSMGLQPYAYGSSPSIVWMAVQTIGTVAAQSYANKTVLNA